MKKYSCTYYNNNKMSVLEKLSEYRKQESDKRNIPPYCVFNNKVMEDLVSVFPKNIDDLKNLKGWGVKTINNYGNDVLTILANPEASIPPGINEKEIIINRKVQTITSFFSQEPEIVLNNLQDLAFKTIYQGKSILLSGEAGTGKTEIIKKFFNDYSKKLKIALTSTTGTSALLMGGTTLHSYLGIGIGNGTAGYLTSIINSRDYLRKRWNDLDIFVIDEISMLDPDLFDKLNQKHNRVRHIK